MFLLTAKVMMYLALCSMCLLLLVGVSCMISDFPVVFVVAWFSLKHLNLYVL